MEVVRVALQRDVNPDRDVEPLTLLVEGMVVGVVQGVHARVGRRDHRRDEAELGDAAVDFADSRVDVMQAGHGDALEALRGGAAVIRQPVVVCAADRVQRRQVLVLVRARIQHDAREDHVDVATLDAHVPESRMRAQVTDVRPHWLVGRVVAAARVAEAERAVADRVFPQEGPKRRIEDHVDEEERVGVDKGLHDPWTLTPVLGLDEGLERLLRLEDVPVAVDHQGILCDPLRPRSDAPSVLLLLYRHRFSPMRRLPGEKRVDVETARHLGPDSRSRGTP